MPKIEAMSFGDVDGLLDWLAEEKDPDICHQIAEGLNHDNPNSKRILKWIVSQPECDRASAIMVLTQTYGYEYVYLDGKESFSPATVEIAEVICNNSEADFYTRNELKIDPGQLAVEPADMIELIEKTCVEKLGSLDKAYLPIPRKLFSQKLGQNSPSTGYFVDEEGIYSVESLPEELRRLFV